MDYSEYMLSAYQNNFKEVKMTEGDLAFLSEQLVKSEYIHGHFSVYKIYSNMKKAGSSMAYKNVHQKVRKILSLALIEEVETQYKLHGAKYYQLSTNGWFNLILATDDPFMKLAVKKYYDKNIIFKTFIYPYFDLQTVMFFLDHRELNAYLRNCCQTTIQTMKEWKSDDQNMVFGLPKEKLLVLSSEELREAIEEKLDRERTKDRDLSSITWARVKQAITKPGLTAWSIPLPKSISDALDLHVKSFLFEQINRASRFPFLESALSKDGKFMTAVEDIEREFRRSYAKLMRRKKED